MTTTDTLAPPLPASRALTLPTPTIIAPMPPWIAVTIVIAPLVPLAVTLVMLIDYLAAGAP